MQITFPPYSKAAERSDYTPVFFLPEIITGIQQECFKVKDGWLLQQQITGEGFDLFKINLHANSRQECFIKSSSNNAVIIVVEEAKGTILKADGQLKNSVDGYLVQLAYYPGGYQWPISLEKSGRLSLYWITISANTLLSTCRHFIDGIEALPALVSAVDKGTNDVLELASVFAQKDSFTALDRLKAEADKPGGKDIWLSAQINLLLRWYFLRLDKRRLEALIKAAGFAITVPELEIVIGIGEMISGALARRLPLQAVAARVGMPTRRLQRIFKYYFKRTIPQYRQALLMEQAIYFLLEKKLPIKVVAISLGYADPSDFTKAFKQFYGMTPSKMLQVQDIPTK